MEEYYGQEKGYSGDVKNIVPDMSIRKVDV